MLNQNYNFILFNNLFIKNQKELKNKYQDRINNVNKYLNKEYPSINKAAKKNLDNHNKIIIDPSNNAQKLEQILGNKVSDSRANNYRKYHPLSENYRGLENKLSLQGADNQAPPRNYNLIGRAGSRGNNLSSITPQSDRKEAQYVSKLKENYKNIDIRKHGYYVPPSGMRKYANINSQRSQPLLNGLKNNLARRYVSNQHSVDQGHQDGIPPAGINSNRRNDLSSAQLRGAGRELRGLNARLNARRQYMKPLSAKTPSWWG